MNKLRIELKKEGPDRPRVEHQTSCVVYPALDTRRTSLTRMRTSEIEKQAVAEALFSAGVIRFGAFKLKLHDKVPDAPLSPFYLDLRVVRSYPDLMDQVTDLFLDLMRGLQFDLIADVPTAGTPFAAIISHKTRIPMITPRLGSKEHGSAARIDGSYRAGQTAVVLDDLVTNSESKLEVIQVLVAQGLLVKDVVVLIDREQGGVQQLKSAGVECHAAFRLSQLLNTYKERGLISTEQFSAISRYLDSQVS
jgi:uridine monophosphate synthetase